MLNGYVNAAQWQDPQATSYVALSLAAMAASGIPPGFDVITGALYEKDTAQVYDDDPVRQVDRGPAGAAARARPRAASLSPNPTGPMMTETAATPRRIRPNRRLPSGSSPSPNSGRWCCWSSRSSSSRRSTRPSCRSLNICNTLTFTVELGLIALAMTLLMTAGEFDLSVGSVFGFAPVLMWTLFNSGGDPRCSVAFLVAHGWSRLCIGLVNGLFVTRLKIPSFLVTLGMLLVVRGTALYVTDGFPQRTWNAEGQWLAEVLVGDFYVGRSASTCRCSGSSLLALISRTMC